MEEQVLRGEIATVGVRVKAVETASAVTDARLSALKDLKAQPVISSSGAAAPC